MFLQLRRFINMYILKITYIPNFMSVAQDSKVCTDLYKPDKIV